MVKTRLVTVISGSYPADTRQIPNNPATQATINQKKGAAPFIRIVIFVRRISWRSEQA